MIPSVAPNALHASVCDEQLLGYGGEIALSGNTVIYSTMLFLKFYIYGFFLQKKVFLFFNLLIFFNFFFNFLFLSFRIFLHFSIFLFSIFEIFKLFAWDLGTLGPWDLGTLDFRLWTSDFGLLIFDFRC